MTKYTRPAIVDMSFTALPDWTMTAKPSALSFFEAIALAGLEGQWIRLSAGTQRKLLGSVVFGKQQLCVNAEGDVSVLRSSCYGMDSERAEYDLQHVRGAAESGKRLSPGTGGGRYFTL